MALIRTSDKHSNLRLRFEHPIVLNPEKKYKLGVSHLMFELDQIFDIENFTFEFNVPTSQGNEDTVTCIIFGKFTIKTLQKEIQNKINYWFDILIKMYAKETEVVKKLKAMSATFKLEVKKNNDNHYTMLLTFPFKTRITLDGNFCTLFKFKDNINLTLKPNETYVSGNILNFVKPLSLIEWHCNIIEYSYANHDSHPHLHKHDELLYIHFIENNFYDNPVCKETCTKIMFIPLRKGLQEIREIVLTPLSENNEKLNLKNITVYLQLKEE
jgi:hypothetical protein